MYLMMVKLVIIPLINYCVQPKKMKKPLVDVKMERVTSFLFIKQSPVSVSVGLGPCYYNRITVGRSKVGPWQSIIVMSLANTNITIHSVYEKLHVF